LKTIVFAAEATLGVGAGHLMRCLAYAVELRQLGYEVLFWGSCEFAWISRDPRYQKISAVNAWHPIDLLILDSYEKDFMEESVHLLSPSRVVQVLDGDAPLFECDGFVWLDVTNVGSIQFPDMNIIAAGIPYLAVKDYSERSGNHKASHALVTFGGSQAGLFIDSFLDVLAQRDFQCIDFYLFVEEKVKYTNIGNFHFFSVGEELHRVSSICDTVITAAGTSLWDFVGNRKVVGVTPVVPNQFSNFQFVTEREFAVDIGGGIHQDDIKQEAIRRLFLDRRLRDHLSRHSSLRPDRLGAFRLANSLDQFLRRSQAK
jgi:spore coat polysaccharide biosynthesis predicted glycosyltransferase SpsG